MSLNSGSIALGLFLVACASPGESPGGTSTRNQASATVGHSPDANGVPFTAGVQVVLDQVEVYAEDVQLSEGTVASGSGCVGGVTVQVADAGTFSDGAPSFVDAEAGTASLMTGLNTHLWIPQGGDQARKWTGTEVVETWTDDLIVLALLDGTYCDSDNTDCVAAEGTITYAGERPAPFVAENPGPSDWVDVVSGEAICEGRLATGGT